MGDGGKTLSCRAELAHPVQGGPVGDNWTLAVHCELVIVIVIIGSDSGSDGNSDSSSDN